MDDKDMGRGRGRGGLVKEYGFKLKKRLGENFLVEVNIINKMMEGSEIDGKSGVIEIGGGMG
ncbi:rRNA adenine N-6-methyltransferase family protein [Staphylococcus auricularis]|uniref:rRNA adenine N-6-methyltransferase family protein n=1 Tax=Staphylococcus auricularis TaxID=29379 RepID=UPI001CDA4B88|nr:rRNA adenine N-6-methyltransferase family protein [Staphylococcus auricularis]